MSGAAIRFVPAADLKAYADAQALFQTGDPKDFAEWSLAMTELIAKDPTYWFAWYSKGVAAARIREDAIACDLFRAAQHFLPKPIPKAARKLAAEMYFNWGRCEQLILRDDSAREHFRVALRLDRDKGPAWAQLGLVHLADGDVDMALRCLNSALTCPDSMEPSIRYNRSLALLLLGRLAEGFAAYEMRWVMPMHLDKHGRPDLTQPRWMGETCTGPVIVWTEQGYGDNLQFLRYLPQVREQVTHVFVQAPLDLHRLIGASYPGVPLLAPGDPIPDYAAHVPFMSLPHVFGTTLETIPAVVPYLRPASGYPTLERRPGRLAVGIAWAGNRDHPADCRRSIPFSALEELLGVGGVDFYSLQVGDREAEAGDDPRLIRSETLGIRDFNDTAGIIEQLDLVIATDTSTAHLAGALAKPVWTIVGAAPDWRWLVGREDTPWYRSMRLIRQRKRGDWHTPIAEAAQRLRAMVEGPR
jgi:tetratricopeptide (TPR) repeat protein